MTGIVIKLILISLLLQTSSAWSEVYRYKNDQGVVSFSDQFTDGATQLTVSEKPYRYKYQVKRVYDGDTIVLQNGDRVRLLGINTPEIESRFRHGEAGGMTAKKWLQDKLKQGTVLLEYDQQKKDKYKRHLAHLFLDSGEYINQSMVRSGLATLSIIPPNLRYADVLIKAEKLAELEQIGIWAMDQYQPISVEKLSSQTPMSGWHRFLASAHEVVETRSYVKLIVSNNVNIRIPKKNLSLFPELSNYLDKNIEIRGWASRSKGNFSILVRHPSALIMPSLN